MQEIWLLREELEDTVWMGSGTKYDHEAYTFQATTAVMSKLNEPERETTAAYRRHYHQRLDAMGRGEPPSLPSHKAPAPAPIRGDATPVVGPPTEAERVQVALSLQARLAFVNRLNETREALHQQLAKVPDQHPELDRNFADRFFLPPLGIEDIKHRLAMLRATIRQNEELLLELIEERERE